MARRTERLTLMAVMTAMMCIAGPLTLPVGPVPVSLLSAVLMLAGMLLGGRMAAGSCGVYLLLGLLGLPVFSGFTGGAGQLLGPTGGFLAGYLPMTALVGAISARTECRSVRALALAAGMLVLYATGTVWYCWQFGASIQAAMAVCVLPFLPFDVIKLAAVLAIAPGLRRRLGQLSRK